ncbi:MAG: hypothetical protein QQN63_09370 [Nitrosopumilus sp.]
MIIVLRKYHRLDIQNNRWMTFAFGDNDTRSGYGGQARACRDEENTIGIRTKKAPNMLKNAFYTDKEFAENIGKIDRDLDKLAALLKEGGLVVFPKNGFGTGAALLRSKAPDTFLHLNNRMRELLLKYRVPEVTEGTIVRAFKPHLQKLIPFRIATKSFERSLEIVRAKLAVLGVEAIDPRIVPHLVRDLYGILNNMDADKVMLPYNNGKGKDN